MSATHDLETVVAAYCTANGMMRVGEYPDPSPVFRALLLVICAQDARLAELDAIVADLVRQKEPVR